LEEWIWLNSAFSLLIYFDHDDNNEIVE